ncbi:2-polyprenyl-6-methoxyphenol hydroxylase-like FAD-dependent oxidoreductase [Nocardia tenerifensis]|uniref:2-polyprenyl-6-methoxyphenol hydroxylase-like FAD-dependent oxidoreductase n=1 Tax=Nocardia tenerifensis TaxID=228006 RepID=A0A318JZU3_9NOCA|nr:FAD-dependent monooxygenase [Nocardia tenerifensis]PXX63267.1 2-polyprenyl-6-methoxyphenol hydroxylase-like FAD-dependent oxidoreductase [Nocardia tenerifensis]
MSTNHPAPAPRILIAGGGIGGNAVALQLLRAGIRATVVERADAPRPGGQAVDLRGPSREVADRMNLLPGIREYQLDERGMKFVDAEGRDIVRMPTELFDGKGAVAEIEITRGDFNQVLLEALAEAGGVDYRYGEWITELAQDETGVDITFASGMRDRFDLVIGADGLHSGVRRMVFGPEEQFSTYLGGYMSFFTLPTPETAENHWFTAHSLVGATNIGLRPDADPSTSKALITIRTEADPALRRDVSAQQDLVRRRLAGGGWEAARFTAAMAEATDFYFDELARIDMPTWWKGRVVLLGDAGYCGSPLSGHGTAMALIGAYVLAGEIAAHASDPERALPRYEEVLRPFVAKAQELPPGGLKAMTPKTSFGIRAGHTVSKLMTSKAMKPLMMKMLTKSESYDLPDYTTQAVSR